MAITPEQSRVQQTAADATAAQNGSNELVKLIRKLRWIGMDDEAAAASVGADAAACGWGQRCCVVGRDGLTAGPTTAS